jgi:HEAT repeat protein
MATSSSRGRKVAGAIFLALLLGGAGIAWMERSALLSWVFVHGLARANDVNRDRWVERVAGLGDAVVPELVDMLGDSRSSACDNARAAIVRMTSDGPSVEARRFLLASRFARGWAGLSEPGKVCALEVAAAWFRGEPAPTPEVASACSRLLAVAARDEHADTQRSALSFCAALLSRPGCIEAVSPGRALARACLSHTDPATRVLAIRLALYPGMDLLEDIVPLLGDPSVEVRRATVVVVGPAEQAVRDEALLPCLHDPDSEVRRLSELALRGRGLRPEHVKLGRTLTDPDPTVRLQVLDLLRRTPDLDAGIWLRRLSHDPSPAVRAAAMRAMCQQSSVDLTDRIDQMARNDPSPTVCLLARYYLKSARAASEEH